MVGQIHKAVVRELRNLGEERGYITTQFRMKLGSPDVVWSIDLKDVRNEKGQRVFRQIRKPMRVPIAVFEVCYSEGQKAIRGSFKLLDSIPAAFKGFVVLPERSLKEDGEVWRAWWSEHLPNLLWKLAETHSDIAILTDARTRWPTREPYKAFLCEPRRFRWWVDHNLFGK